MINWLLHNIMIIQLRKKPCLHKLANGTPSTTTTRLKVGSNWLPPYAIFWKQKSCQVLNENHSHLQMFHVEHAKNQKSAKNKFCGFFSFSNYFQKNEKKAWLFEIFGAGAPVVGQRLFCMGLKNVWPPSGEKSWSIFSNPPKGLWKLARGRQ